MERIRLAHISDLHVMASGCRWGRDDWLNKRMAAWLNLRFLGRGFLFRRTDDIVSALMADLRERQHDRIVFSGDATALGFEEEVSRAAALLGLNGTEPLPGLAVPGNHDYCTHRAAASGHFEQHFAPWQQGTRIDGSVYPFAQRVGSAWLIGVNSARANRWAWDASGHVGRDQLERLRLLLRQLDPGPRILVTHYPVCRSSGKLEFRTHRLSDVHALTEIAQEGRVCLWLHGHLHRPHTHPRTFLTPFPLICAGSTTQSKLWSYGEYTIMGHHLAGLRRVFDPDTKQFRDAEMFDLDLSQNGQLARRVDL
jgi:3',5'-cyclic AMP phosphodiesterase CpdA